MSIIELLEHVGAENVELQNLSDSFVRAQVLERDGEITFATDRSTVMSMILGECDKAGLIVWIPKSRLPQNAMHRHGEPQASK